MKFSFCVRLWCFAAMPFGAAAAQIPLPVVPSPVALTPGDALKRGDALVRDARSADDAWSVVTTFTSSHSPRSRRPGDPLSRDAWTQAETYIQASLAARQFQTSFPADARRGDARKREVLYALQAGQAGAGHYKTTATTLATAYRADKTNTSRDRFDVAFLTEGIALAATLQGRRFIDDGAKYEALADALHAELGDTHEVYGLYVSIVRTTDIESSVRVANKLLAGRAAPQWVKSQARTAVERSQLIGAALAVKLTTMGGRTLDLARPIDRPTVVYFWHASAAPTEMAALEHFKPSFKVQPRYIYVGLGSRPPVSDRPMAGTPFADMHCFEAAQIGAPATSVFKVPQTPYAFVLDSAGRVVGYGAPEKIAALLDAAVR